MLTFLLAALVGLSLGLLGAGGSVLAVPILRYLAGLSAKHAVATSLATVGAVSLVGGLLAWRDGRLRWRETIEFSLVASMGTVLGVRLAANLSDRVQMGLFVLTVAAALISMGRPRSAGAQVQPQQTRRGMVAKAFGVGVLTGLVGVGGGFLIVPALMAIYGLPVKEATGTSLGVIALNSLTGILTYSGTIRLDWSFTWAFVGAALSGLLVGLAVGRRVESRTTERLFLAALVAVGLFTAGRELGLW